MMGYNEETTQNIALPCFANGKINPPLDYS